MNWYARWFPSGGQYASIVGGINDSRHAGMTGTVATPAEVGAQQIVNILRPPSISRRGVIALLAAMAVTPPSALGQSRRATTSSPQLDHESSNSKKELMGPKLGETSNVAFMSSIKLLTSMVATRVLGNLRLGHWSGKQKNPMPIRVKKFPRGKTLSAKRTHCEM